MAAEGGNSENILITRDLLGGLSNKLPQNHFNPDFQIPLHFQACSNSNTEMKEEEEEMELKLNNNNTNYDNSNNFISSCQSVCTLEKVKSALQTQRSQNYTNIKKRHRFINESDEEEEEEEEESVMFAAACPGCFMYVMTFTKSPLCPRCNSTVLPSFSYLSKKLRQI
ncbi:hypothetical protein M5689_006391 [Euphorbia peplus]|nr:hypothetical protein M5689_006391 [Euphorbia peplus]